MSRDSRWARDRAARRDSRDACTAAVEEVIDEHYAQQIARIEQDDDLKDKISQFRETRSPSRRSLAQGAERTPGYRLLSATIKAGCRSRSGCPNAYERTQRPASILRARPIRGARTMRTRTAGASVCGRLQQRSRLRLDCTARRSGKRPRTFLSGSQNARIPFGEVWTADDGAAARMASADVSAVRAVLSSIAGPAMFVRLCGLPACCGDRPSAMRWNATIQGTSFLSVLRRGRATLARIGVGLRHS